MAKGQDQKFEKLSLPASEMLQLTLLTNEILADEKTVDKYKLRNANALARAKSLVMYKNGITKLPVSIKRLQKNTLEAYDHSLALSGNMQLARGELQLPGTDAHHIVSRTHERAILSRDILFSWRIGIDDADNGVFLPAERGANIRGLEKANVHDPIHTKFYHLTVATRLQGRSAEGASAGR